MHRRPWWAWPAAATTLGLQFVPTGPDPGDPVAASWLLVQLSWVVLGWLLLGQPGRRVDGGLALGAGLLAATDGLKWLDDGPWAVLQYTCYPLAGVLIGWLVLRWPRRALQTDPQRWFVTGALIGVPLLRLADVLCWDPSWTGYRGDAWWPTVVHVRALSDWVYRVSQGYQLVLLVGFLVLLGLRVARTSRLERWELTPVLVAGAGFVVSTVLEILSGGPDGSGDVVGLLTNVAVLAIPLSFLTSVVVQRLQRALAVERLTRPEQLSDVGATRTALARALGDRTLQLQLWSTAAGTYVDADGGPAPPLPDRHCAIEATTPDGAPVARLVVSDRVGRRPELVESVVRGAAVALDNARLQAELRAGRAAARRSDELLVEADRTHRLLSTLVPGDLADRLRAEPGAVDRTEQLTVTVLMSDVRGYSGIAERTDPVTLAAQLNEHRCAMNGAVLAAGGTVMQYVGDAVLAVFGGPRPLADHEDCALRAAERMHAAQAELDDEWARRGREPFGLGIGISTGVVAAGFLGSRERLEYTLVGDTVNLAARLTDAARPAGVTIASAVTVRAADPGWPAELLPPFRVRGRATSVTAFRVSGPCPSPQGHTRGHPVVNTVAAPSPAPVNRARSP